MQRYLDRHTHQDTANSVPLLSPCHWFTVYTLEPWPFYDQWHDYTVAAHIVDALFFSCLPCPTVSPCWAEWWPAWGASGIHPHWTTDYAPQTSHSSGTCRGKHGGRREKRLVEAYITLSVAALKCFICPKNIYIISRSMTQFPKY